MSDDDKIIQVDDDWKAEAKREKEKLADVAEPREAMPDASFTGLIDMIAMQALISLGGAAGPGGEQIPPNPATAKHFVDMLQVLDDKTKNNLVDEERKHLDAVLYEVRMRYVQTAGAGAVAPRPAT